MQHHPYFFQELVEESGNLSRGDARSDSNPEWYPLVALARWPQLHKCAGERKKAKAKLHTKLRNKGSAYFK